jgi:hypothetical protein
MGAAAAAAAAAADDDSRLGLDRKNADGLVALDAAEDFLLLLLFFAVDGEATVDLPAATETGGDFCGLDRPLLRGFLAALPVTMVACTADTAPPTAAMRGLTTTLATGILPELLPPPPPPLLELLLLLLAPPAASLAACSAAILALYAACSSRLRKRPPGPRLRLHAWRWRDSCRYALRFMLKPGYLASRRSR